MRLLVSILVVSVLMAWTTAKAQDKQSATRLSVELNRLTNTSKGCQMTFVGTNRLASSLKKASLEVVIFNLEGLVERIAVLDLKAIPKGKTRVRRFTIPTLKCEAMSRLLVNSVPVCDGDGITPDQCLDQLVTTTKTKAAFGS